MNERKSLVSRLDQEYSYKSLREIQELAKNLSEVAKECKKELSLEKIDNGTIKLMAEIQNPERDITGKLKRSVGLLKDLEGSLSE